MAVKRAHERNKSWLIKSGGHRGHYAIYSLNPGTSIHAIAAALGQSGNKGHSTQ